MRGHKNTHAHGPRIDQRAIIKKRTALGLQQQACFGLNGYYALLIREVGQFLKALARFVQMALPGYQQS